MDASPSLVSYDVLRRCARSAVRAFTKGSRSSLQAAGGSTRPSSLRRRRSTRSPTQQPRKHGERDEGKQIKQCRRVAAGSGSSPTPWMSCSRDAHTGVQARSGKEVFSLLIHTVKGFNLGINCQRVQICSKFATSVSILEEEVTFLLRRQPLPGWMGLLHRAHGPAAPYSSPSAPFGVSLDDVLLFWLNQDMAEYNYFMVWNDKLIGGVLVLCYWFGLEHFSNLSSSEPLRSLPLSCKNVSIVPGALYFEIWQSGEH